MIRLHYGMDWLGIGLGAGLRADLLTIDLHLRASAPVGPKTKIEVVGGLMAGLDLAACNGDSERIVNTLKNH